MAAPRLIPERKIPRELTRFSELSKFLSENNIKLFSKEEYNKYDIINYFFEQASTDDAFYIIDLGEIVEQYKKWETLLPRVKPFYAVKSCSDPLVLKILSVLGCGFSCTNKTEIISVTDQNISTDRIVYTNPIKDSKSIKFARSQNVDYLAFDNETELYKIKLYHPYAKLIIRINPNDHVAFSKFGCSLSEAKFLLEKAKALELNVIGVTFEVEKKSSDLKTYRSAIQFSREIFKIADSLNMRMSLLDIGSGFPGSDKHATLKFEDIAHTINEALEEYFGDIEGLKVIAEPGRYFSTKSHTLLFNVIGKRKCNDDNGDAYYQYYMNDGIYGSFRCIIFEGATPEIIAFNRRSNQNYKSTLFGPTCETMDIIARNVELPEMGIGDWCYVEEFGAYTQKHASDSDDHTMSENNYVFMY